VSVEPGLCASCLHARRVQSRRGSVFRLCSLSHTDARFPRYPRLPVLRCAGYERTLGGGAEATRSERDHET
jgi:hypothetical protein